MVGQLGREERLSSNFASFPVKTDTLFCLSVCSCGVWLVEYRTRRSLRSVYETSL